MKFSLGPILYYWHQDQLTNFYQEAIDCHADIIYLGEAVCSKRRAMKIADWLVLAKLLADSGKQVVLSTLALLQSPSELQELRRYINNGDFLIEANDMAAVNIASEAKLPFVAGHALNCYNAYALKILHQHGMIRWCPPVELSRQWLTNIKQQCETIGIQHQFEIEVFAYGYLPLAYSARCFTARSENKAKDECATCCQHYPQGKTVFSQEKQKVFVLNGIQTQSGSCYNLGNELETMTELVDIVRLSAHDQSIFSTLELFRANQQGLHPLALTKERECNGYWHGQAGITLQD